MLSNLFFKKNAIFFKLLNFKLLLIFIPSPGFEALTEIQNLVTSNVHDPSYKESLIIDASNRFFTVIPSIHPHVIRDEDDLKSKVNEALDVEMYYMSCILSRSSDISFT